MSRPASRVVGLFGGSFNPPHVAHQLVALYVLETLVDEVWFVPTYSHPFGKPLVAYDHRVAMCELAAAPLGARARVSRAEQELAHRPDFVASRTLDLVEHLYASFPDVELRLVVGADILGETDKWYRWDDLVARAPLIVVGRGGYTLPDGSQSTGIEMPQVSATRIRDLLAHKDPTVSALLPQTVLRYIARHGLYT
ncbi:MAG TPA: nicotinate (nicotinamide) nucleotide adenylyltransferase [Kofleriaceae bacterium]|nr:nicotinate (nicotinamide) nucleotide adenylyltransferase [Kofleriaceae bacterium]